MSDLISIKSEEIDVKVGENTRMPNAPICTIVRLLKPYFNYSYINYLIN